MTEPEFAYDAGAAALADVFTTGRALAAERRAWADALAVLARLRKAAGATDSRLAPARAVPVLVAFRAALEQQAERAARGYSAQRWLWYLRRLPDVLFKGRVSTTLPYTLALAEVLTDQAAGDGAPVRRGQWISFKVDEHVARHVLALVFQVRIIFTIHSLIRQAGKGCDIVFDATGVPRADCTAPLRESMTMFDDRMAKGQHLLSRAGTPLPLKPAWEDAHHALLLCYRTDPQVVDARAALDVTTDVRLRVQFIPMLAAADALKTFNARFGRWSWWQPEAVLLTLFLALCSHLLFHLPNAALSLMQFGYLVTDMEVLRAVETEYWAAAVALASDILGIPVAIPSMDSLIEDLRRIRGNAWPMVAPGPLRGTNDLMALDLASATSRFANAFEFPSATGDVANVRAAHFEEEIQQVIDESPWRPRDEVRALRGRALRCGAQTISDIDAIGEREETVLLVSAKSRVYTAPYDAGDHAQIRNAAQSIEEAVARWREVTAFLAAHPKGDNYDFGGGRDFLGLVCTPQVVWTPLGDATRDVAPGLRAASSVEELERWLGGF